MLKGKTILVTRAEHQSNELVSLIAQHGGTAVTFPTIQIRPPDSWEECDGACLQIQHYDGLVFTSGNGVDGFIKRYHSLNLPIELLKSKVVYAVGEKTERSLKEHGIEVRAIPEKFTSDDLAKTLTHEMIAGKRFLFPKGQLGKNPLIDHFKSMNGKLDPVVVYLTQKAERRDVKPIRQMFDAGSIDVVTFTSPSTAKNFFELIPDFKSRQRSARLAVIGPVTAAAVEKLGYHTDITAKNSTIESMIEAIIEFFTKNKGQIRKL